MANTRLCPTLYPAPQGDQVVEIKMVLPRALSPRQLELIREFEQEELLKKGGGVAEAGAKPTESSPGSGTSSESKGSESKGWRPWGTKK